MCKTIIGFESIQIMFAIHKIYSTHPPVYDHVEGIIYIPVINAEKLVVETTKADIEDASMLLQYSYSLTGHCGKYYVKSNIGTLIHRFIIGCENLEDLVVDHRDGDPLNNLRTNLRPVTHAQNAQNKPKMEGCSSQYIGVHLDRSNRWRAFISCNGKMKYLGSFEHEYDAAKMYDIHRIATLGPESRTNGTLKQYEIDWIAAHGVPPEHEKVEKKRDLPKNITPTVYGTYRFSRTIKGNYISKTFKTLEEAIAYKQEVEENKTEKEHDRRTEIIRNSKGEAVIYAKQKGVIFEIVVDDETWGDVSSFKWIMTRDLYATCRKASEINGETCMHRYLWAKYRGEIPKGFSIDHVNSKCKLDMRLNNLRPADQRLQNHNKSKRYSVLDKYRSVEFIWPYFRVVIDHVFYGKFERAEDAAQKANDVYSEIYEDNANLNEIDWNIVTTKDNRITLNMINEEFINKLTRLADFDNLIRVMRLDHDSGGPITVSSIKKKNIPTIKQQILDAYFRKK